MSSGPSSTGPMPAGEIVSTSEPATALDSLPKHDAPASDTTRDTAALSLRAARSAFSAAPAEPDEWRPPPSLRERIGRAISTPVLAGATAFVIAVVIAIVLVWIRPHGPAAGEAASVLSGESDGSETSPDSEAGGKPDDATSAATGEAAGAAADTVAPTDAGGRVFVHVVGEVEHSGVVELDAGERVEAAIEAAGGATDDAVLSGLNLARAIVDGEQIVVPDAETAAEIGAGGPSGGAAPGNGAAPGVVGGSAAEGAQVNLNSADATGLETLPGVGPALAARIIEWREANGRFDSVEQLLEVSGIGAKTLEGLRERVTV